MRFTQSLEKKYKLSENENSDFKKPPVASSLTAFLKQQSARIEHLLEKKRIHETKLHKISTQDLKRRDQLRQRIEQEQEKHDKNRNKFLGKRVKEERFKLDELERKRAEHMKRRRSENKLNQDKFRQMKESTKEYWSKKEAHINRTYANQVEASPLYEEAVNRKKAIENRNIEHGSLSKEKLLTRHNSTAERIRNMVESKLMVLEEHNEQIREDQKRHEELMRKREEQFINKICSLQDRSEEQLNKNKDEWEKKLKYRMICKEDQFSKTHENFATRTGERAKSMKNCSCHSKGKSINPELGMTRSINFQDGNQDSQMNTSTNWHNLQGRKKDFMMQSMSNLSSVRANRQTLRDQQQLREEKKLMEEKEITEAVKMRSAIRNDSNCLVRQARLIG